MEEITDEQYQNALNIVRKYEYQFKPKTVQVSVMYNATISSCINVPAEWDIETIKSELEDGVCHDHDKEDEDYIRIVKMIELIVNGHVIKL